MVMFQVSFRVRFWIMIRGRLTVVIGRQWKPVV